MPSPRRPAALPPEQLKRMQEWDASRRASSYRDAKESEAAKLQKLPFSKEWPLFLVMDGASFFDSPEQGVPLYWYCLKEGYLTKHRKEMLNRGSSTPSHPVLYDWNISKKSPHPAAWKAFLNQVCQSTNLTWKMEGIVLKALTGYEYDMVNSLGQEMLVLLGETQAMVTNEAGLVVVWNQARDGIAKLVGDHGGAQGRTLRTALLALGSIPKPLQAPAAPAPVVATAVSAVVAPPSAAMVSTNSAGVELTNRWIPEVTLRPQRRVRTTTVAYRWVDYRAGKLWVNVEMGMEFPEEDVNNPKRETLYEASLYQIDPDTLATDRIHTTPPAIRTNWFPSNTLSDVRTGLYPFELVGEELVHVQTNRLRAYNLTTKQWRELPVELPLRASLSVVDGRLFIIAPTALMEYNLRTGRSVLLASTRRSTPESPLDRAPSLNTHLFQGPNGWISTMVGNQLFMLNAVSNIWEVGPMLKHPSRSQIVKLNQGFLSCSVLDQKSTLIWIRPNEPLMCLFDVKGGRGFETEKNPYPVVWPDLKAVSPTLRMDFDGRELYQVTQTMDGGRELVFYSTNHPVPIAVPLRFPKENKKPFTEVMPLPEAVMLLPRHLLVAGNRAPGFWLVSRAELASVVAAARQAKAAAEREVKPTAPARSDVSIPVNGIAYNTLTVQRGTNKITITQKDFDLNNDGFLDREEKTAYEEKRKELLGNQPPRPASLGVRKPNPPAAGSNSPLPRLKPMDFDLNKDGKLDDAEMKVFMERRSALQTSRTNGAGTPGNN